MNLNLRDLEYFYQLSKLRSFTNVAKYFRVSQPTISYAIKRLESYYDCDLFYKDSSHQVVDLTPEGDLLAMRTNEILSELNHTKKAIHRSSMKDFKVGFPPIISSYLLSKILKEEESLNFLNALHMIYDGSNELLSQLLNGEIDSSLLGSLEKIKHPELEIEELFQKEFFIIMSDHHPLASKKELAFKDLLNEDFILLGEHNIHFTAFNLLNEKYNHSANAVLKLDDAHTIKELVRKNLGISLMADIGLSEDFKHLVKIPLIEADKQYFHINYAYQKIAILSESEKNFLEILKTLK
ncbi:LysR family transcriptional regulator [Lactococcus cremoris]|uniref:LysR family transcriptional regulator n=2 Tax=Lactococcus lactis subsp. cremoris TaxID=1359 RepID=UPI00117AEE63|nr:LysR family transcriptional regulator [Lactococcus cremoris]MCT0504180.1 LysR family transcriptional regulator [Lactococcus cremoris]MCT0505003.1 LysR family transcriptional regulator [Lactococcus cremoris]TRW54408.1 LysR family transcriptional regulator [Lactococcus lactis]